MATVIITSLIVLAVLLALGASLPASSRSRERDAVRRQKVVERHPDQVNSGDILRLLVVGGVAERDARLVVEKAAVLAIKPITMWLWMNQFDARTLVTVVAADLKHQQLLAHLGAGTLPDLEQLSIFASLNGIEVQDVELTPTVRSARAARRTSDVAPVLPVIHDAGSWPYGDLDLPADPLTEQNGGSAAA